MFKITKGLEIVEWEKDLSIKERTRGNNLSYNRESFKSIRRNDFAFCRRERHNFFVNRVAPSWNILPPNVINSSCLNCFKAALDQFTKNGHLNT